jgi:hypothetical protein
VDVEKSILKDDLFIVELCYLEVVVDLLLSIKVFGTDGLRAAGQVLHKTFDLRTVVCGPYNTNYCTTGS